MYLSVKSQVGFQLIGNVEGAVQDRYLIGLLAAMLRIPHLGEEGALPRCGGIIPALLQAFGAPVAALQYGTYRHGKVVPEAAGPADGLMDIAP